MTNHPLTNEICSELTRTHPLTDKIIAKQFGRYDGIDDVMVYNEDDIRAAYDLGRKDQIKADIEWLEINADDYECKDYYHTYFLTEIFLNDFKKAMRQTQENN